MRKWSMTAAVLVGLGIALVGEAASLGDDSKVSINDIMKQAHSKDGLRGKMISGKASKDEQQQLLDLYIALGKNKPPKGDAASWKKRTDAIVKATQDFMKDPKAKARFGNVTRCKDCHDQHKGE